MPDTAHDFVLETADHPALPAAAPAFAAHPTAVLEPGVTVGPGTAVWDNVHIRRDTVIGADCVIGEKTYIAYNVRVGDRCKINSFVYICTAVTLQDGVMVSAGTVFTNDRFPRAATPDLARLNPSAADDDTLPTLVREGATIGANCTIGCGLVVGRFAMVGMGSVVTKSVPDFALAVGNPAAVVGAVCRCGRLLHRHAPDAPPRAAPLACATCDRTYAYADGRVEESEPEAARA